VEHEDGTAAAVQAIQSLTCSAFERASRIVLSHRLIAWTFSSKADECTELGAPWS
jgi:hypothetical protein